MKKFFYSMAVAAMVAGAPMTMVSCDEDDVNTIVNIISEILSTNDLAGSQWDNRDDKDRLVLSFESATSGNLYDYTKMDSEGYMTAQAFTYTLDTTNNIITITLSSGGTRRYTVQSFTKGSSLVLSYGGKTITMYPYTE
ncbi:MAG: hypothetical protein IJT98_04580 [Prevotella sp.]|nr:hypothetical protein [Prevotella sp.]